VSAVAATFFDGRSSRAHPVRVGIDGGMLMIQAGDWQRSEPPASVRVTPRVAGIHRTLLLSDGGQVQVQDNDAVDAWFPGRDRASALIDRLERHSVAVAASLLITVLGLFGLIFYGIPYAAQKIAANIPDAVAREMGEQTVTLLDRLGFDASELPKHRQDELQAVFKKYVADLPEPSHYQLRFMKAKFANAFALPGGIIVVTDTMVRIVASPRVDATATNDDDGDGDDAGTRDDAKSQNATKAHDAVKSGAEPGQERQVDPDDEINAEDRAANERFLAVVAHEIGHEEHKHVLRSVLQSSAVVLAGAYFTGDVSSASALVISVPTFLLDSHYSRDFEVQADDYAFTSLVAHHISPARFAEVMTAMQRADPHFRHETGYLATHPPTVGRIMKAREAAERFDGQQ
jgi:Zn-dependent protease with chaperone function